MPWFWLIVGGLFEVGFTTSLRFVDGFRNLPWTLAFLALGRDQHGACSRWRRARSRWARPMPFGAGSARSAR